MKLFFILFLIVFIFIHYPEPDEGALLEPVQIVNFADALNLSRYNLTCAASEFIATDSQSRGVHVIGYDTLEPATFVGKEGRGPEEFLSIGYSAVYDKNLFISDAANQRISVFNKNNGSYQSVFPNIRTHSRFAVSSDYIYISSPFSRENLPFMKVAMDGTTEYFGKWLKHEFFGRNVFHLLMHENKIIAVSTTEPIIKFYNRSGEFLSSHNLENDTHLSSILQFTHEFYLDSDNYNRTVKLFNDVSVFDDYLVLNFFTRPGGRLKTNNYLVYKIEESTLEKVLFFETNVGEGFTNTFCIHENRLFSTAGPDGIDLYIFDLSQLSMDSF